MRKLFLLYAKILWILIGAFDKDGMHPEEFLSFGATVHTMNTFLDGYDEFISLIRNHMIKE